MDFVKRVRFSLLAVRLQGIGPRVATCAFWVVSPELIKFGFDRVDRGFVLSRYISYCIALRCITPLSVFRIPPFGIPNRVRRVFRIPPSGFRIPLLNENVALNNSLPVTLLGNFQIAFFLQAGDYF